MTAEFLFKTYGKLPEGDLTRIRAALVCEQSLYEVAKFLGLGQYLKLGKGEEAGGGRQRQSILADATEAVFAAVYLDGGIESASALIHRCLLDIEGEHLSLLPHQLAQKGGVVPAAGGGVDAQVPRLDVLGDDFMGNPQCVQSHHLFYSSLLASSLISSIASLPLRCSTVISSIHSGFQSCSMARWRLSSLSCGA